MSKLKLKRIKEQDNGVETSLENMKSDSNPVGIQKNLNMQHLFVDKSPSENMDANCQSSFTNIESQDCKTSKYFITSSLPDVAEQFDESEVEFQSEKRPRRKAVTPQKVVRKKNKPLRRKGQKDIRDVMNSKKDDLLKYTQQFERECAAGGVDVNPEHLQLAIALSRSLTDFRKSDNDGDEPDRNSPVDSELTSSQETAFKKNRIISIRKTLDEFGFKVRRTSNNAVIKPNVKKKRGKRICNYPLLLRTQEEKSQRIIDCVSQTLFQSVSNIPQDSKVIDNIPSGVSLNEIWCESSCIFTKSCHAYEDIKENDVYYTANLMTHSTAKVGCLLRDWGSIPGREKSPERYNDQPLDFRDSELYANNFEVLLSGTRSMITARASKLSKWNSPNCSVSEVNQGQNIEISNKQFIEEVHVNTSRCSSPDLFGDDSCCEGNIFHVEGQKPEDISSIVVNDSSDDELPRVYISQSQMEYRSTLPIISEDCLEGVNTLDCDENTCTEDIKNQSPNQSYDLTQDDSDENSLSNQNDSISLNQKSNSQLDEIKDVKNCMTAVDASHILESSDSIINTSENLNLSEVYEGRNGIIHYESFQTSPVFSMPNTNSNNSFKKSFYIDSSSHSSEEDIFESTQVQDVSFNLDKINTCNIKSFTDTKDLHHSFNETVEYSQEGIDLTQSSKDSNASLSYTLESKEIDKHVSCQSMLIANRLSFGINITKNLNLSSNEKIESDHVLFSSILHNSPKDVDQTFSANGNGDNLSVAYSLNCDTDDKQETSKNELSTESSACNDIFVISDEEFNYSMSTPYNNNEKLLQKTLKSKKFNCENISYVSKNSTASMSKIESPESDKSIEPLCEEKESIAAVTRDGSALKTVNKTYGSVYNLDLGGSSIFDRIPSCNSSFLGNYIVQNNVENKGNDTPYTSKSNVISDFTDSTSENIKPAFKNPISGDEILSNVIHGNRISAICSVTPNLGEYLIETNNVTPVQDFNYLDTPKMLKELSRFGLKPLKRKRAVQLLEHIYNETHPLLPSKLPLNKRQRLKDNDFSSSDTSSECKLSLEISIEEKYAEDTENEHLSQFNHGQKDAAEKSYDSIENNEDIQDDSDIYLPDLESIAIKQIKCDPDDWIFQNREKAKIYGCRVPLHIAFHNYLSVRSKLQDAILCYEPVNIETIHRGLISDGYKYNTKDLFHFMDKKCITIKTTVKNVATKRQKKR